MLRIATNQLALLSFLVNNCLYYTCFSRLESERIILSFLKSSTSMVSEEIIILDPGLPGRPVTGGGPWGGGIRFGPSDLWGTPGLIRGTEPVSCIYKWPTGWVVVPSRLFADDMAVYLTVGGSDDGTVLQTDLDRLAMLEGRWGMEFNPSKCQVVRVTTARKSINIMYKLHGPSGCHKCKVLGG